MATMSSPGIGTSGLDVKSIISQLVALEKRPLDTLKLQAATTTTKISAFGQIKSLVSTLSDAASKLTSVTGWSNVSTTSSDKDFVSATAIGGTLATSFNVEVQALAKSQSTASGSVTGAVGVGTLTIKLGSWGAAGPAGGAFVADTGVAAVGITVSASDSVADVASKINGSNAGVTATILTDAGGQRLLLRSKETGLQSGFELTTADGVPGGLQRLTTAQVTPGATQIAANAQATVNGIAVESATNTFADSVAGVTFKAEKVTDPLKPPITISVAKDTSAVQANVEAFVKAYNEVNKAINDGTKYDQTSKSAGLLQGDATALGLQSALRSAMQAVSPGSTVYQRLADIGVVQKTSSDPMATAALGGELTVDTTKLNKALTDNPDEVKKFFRGDSNVATNGLAVKVKTLTAGLLSTDGFFKSKEKVLEASLERNAKDVERVNLKVSNFEKRTTARYTALDTQMSSLTALNAYISQQVTAWNKSSG
jgi:flagellar hook-associated protein 2